MRARWSSRSTRWRLVAGAATLAAVAAIAIVSFAVVHRSDDDLAEICTLVGYFDGVFVESPLGKDRPRLDAFRRSRLNATDPKRADRLARRFVRETVGLRRVTMCVDGRCEDVEPLQLVRHLGPAAAIPQAHPPTVRVAVVIDLRGGPLQVATGTLPVERDEPNGRGCGFRYRASGRVVGPRIVGR